MKIVFGIIGSAISVAATVFLFAAIGTIFGAVSGFVVGLAFQDIILHVLTRLGIDTVDLYLWQIGATLGFIGPFFRTSVTTKNVVNSNKE